MKRTTSLFLCLSSVGVIGLFGWQSARAQLVAPTCPQTSDPTIYRGPELTAECGTGSTNACTTKSGVVAVGDVLQLQKTGALFKSTSITTPGTIMYATSGDFNKDGFTDFIGASENTSNDYLTIFRNFTWQNENCTTAACTTYSGPAPNWTDPSVVVTPKFTAGLNLHTTNPSLAYNGRYALAAADFNGDGWPDLFEGFANSAASPSWTITTLHMYINKAVNDGSGNAQWNLRYNPVSGFTPSSVFGSLLWSTDNSQPIDYNADGKMDVLIASSKNNGAIHVLLNNCPGTMQGNGVFLCSSNPTFTDGGYLIRDLNMVAGVAQGFGTGNGGTGSFAYGDVTGDGLNDLVVGAPNCCNTASRRLRLFKGCVSGAGCTGKLETVASQSLAFAGGATDVFIEDFSLDGKPDVIVMTDNFNYNSGAGGTTYYFANNGTATPFSAVATILTTPGSPTNDFDLGFVFDYDADPDRTPDVFVADGNNSASYYILANRVTTQYVPCGDVVGGVVDLGTLTNSDVVINSARITPTFSLNGGTVRFYMSNEEPASWVMATLCPSSTTDYCATFPKAVGRTVRWKATVCSNTSNTVTPTISGVTLKYGYTQASEHYRSGVVVSDGVAYIGGFRQPGDRGKFYAVDAGLTTTYWETGNKLDNVMSDAVRNLFTSVNGSQLGFTTANAGSNSSFKTALNAPDFASAQGVVAWVRSKRFGLGTSTSPSTHLGAVVTSSPAIISKPGRPNWYAYSTAVQRSAVDGFVGANANRVPLVLFGAKDGMIHATYSIATNTSDTRNGQEAWAYIPPTILPALITDKATTDTANAAATDGVQHTSIKYYPDGSPTLVDAYSGGIAKTVALVSEGNGGRNFSVFDVTQTVNPTNGTVIGPTPMWNATSGGTAAGMALAKPTVARVSIGGVVRFIAIGATSVDPNDTTKGRIVTGYDLADGTVLWTFQAKCAVTSDITAFETDDALEANSPTLDGNIDRIVFSDNCGYVYKLDPGVNLSGGWLRNTGMGTINTGTTPDGKIQYALFSSNTTSGALGADRPIAGTIGARIDSSTRMILYFGTGGIETVSTTLLNHFYAIYADTGAIRSKYVGVCVASQCEKFYGGVVVTPTQVILTRTIDPAVATNTCDDGASTIQVYQLNANGSGDFVPDFKQDLSSAVMSALYGDAGAIYFASIGGNVTRIGTPRAAAAGGDSASGQTQGTGAGQNGPVPLIGGSAFTLLGWRVVL